MLSVPSVLTIILSNGIYCYHLLQVMIIRGKDKGETGVVKRVVRSQNRVIVEGKNLVRQSSVFPFHMTLFVQQICWCLEISIMK